MEKNFDFGALLRTNTNNSKNNNEKKHKKRPTQFDSVAEGTYKRLQKNIKNRKSNRLTIFDSIRSLPLIDPVPVSDAQLKVEHRRQQLEKWKEEKEKKKREAAAQKKKPFVAGVAHAPLKYVPPPPPPPKPSTSGRVTRSQASKSKASQSSPSSTTRKNTKSFAPKNAPFRPPELKNLVHLPKLMPPSKTKMEFVAFEPVEPSATVRQTRSKNIYNRPPVSEVRPGTKIQNETRSTLGKSARIKIQNESRSTLGKSARITTQNNRFEKKTNQFKSSSSSELETSKSKSIKSVQTLGIKKSELKPQPLATKQLMLSSESYSSDEKVEEQVKGPSKRKSLRKSIISVNESASDTWSSQSKSSLDEPKANDDENKIQNEIRPQSLKANRPQSTISISDCSVILVESPLIRSQRKHFVTPKPKVPNSESSSEQKLRSPKTPNGSPLTPEQIELVKKISPCVTLSRGKDNARREMKWKIDEGLLDDDAVENDGVDHFRQQLASEVARITARCELWDSISQQNTLPESVQELVLTAVGQGRLLVSQKLRQFSSLVERCATPEPGTALITTTDLRGFWDMLFMQVENIDMRFKKLEELQERGWVEEQSPIAKVATRAAPGAKKIAKKAATSKLKDVIAAARKAKKQQDAETIAPPPTITTPEAPNEKTFEAGFFTVRSPVHSPVRTPCKQTLLKAVLSSEAKKTASRNSASFAMLRASILGKNTEYEGIAPLPQTPQVQPINLLATPGRSILKSSHTPLAKSANKSIKLVLFNDTNNTDKSPIATEDIAIGRYVTADKISTEETSPGADEELQIKDKPDELGEKQTDSGISSTEKIQDKTEPKKILTRQYAIDFNKTADISPVKTRSKRKSVQTPKVEEENEDTNDEDQSSLKSTRRSLRKRVEDDTKTPRQTGRKKKEKVDLSETNEVKKTPRKSAKKKALQELEVNVLEEIVPTPKRSLRSRKSVGAQNVGN